MLSKGGEKRKLQHKLWQLGNHQHNVKVLLHQLFGDRSMYMTLLEIFLTIVHHVLSRPCHMLFTQNLIFQVVKEGEGDLIVAKRPEVSTPASNYVPCVMCLGFYLQGSLHTHFKRCLLRTPENASGASLQLQEGVFLLQPYLPCPDKLDNPIIYGMKDTTDKEGDLPS